MKSNREIRQEANFLYSKSSHYIVSLFMMIGAITGTITGVLTVIANYLNMPLLIVLAVLLAPFEYGIIKAVLLSYDRKAKEVSGNGFTFLGIKKLHKSFIPFVGKDVVIALVQILVFSAFIVMANAPTNDLMRGLLGIFGKQIDYIYADNQFLVTGIIAIGFFSVLLIGILLECVFSLSYYLVVDKDQGLIKSLSGSINYMKGNLWKFIKLRLSFIPHIFICSVILGIINYFISDTIYGWFQLVNIDPFILDILVSITYGIISSVITVMIYSVKQELAFVVFYKEVTKE